MTHFTHVFKQNYDKRLKLGGESLFGYSKKKLRELYPEKNYTIVGEAKSAKPKKKKTDAAEEKKNDRRIGHLSVDSKSYDLFKLGAHKRAFYRQDGYICVGEDSFVVVHSCRIPFLVTLFVLLALIAVTSVLIVQLLMNPKPPVVINPDHPLPDIDPEIEHLPPSDDDEKVDSNGGGFVSIVYTKDAVVSLATNKATIFYQNPNKSNHSVVIELYLVSGDAEYFLGRTGLIPAGSAIYEIDVSERDANVRAGIYTGLYRLFYYDPITGERAALSSDVTEIQISVNEQ